MKLVVGLGNPGKEYINTRHNIGFWVLDNYLGDVKWSKKFNGEYYQTTINGEKYLFLKPLSYMNLSGSVVYNYVKYFKININDIFVIQDDLDLPLGKYKIKINSSSGGHNGIKDIISCLGTNEFARLKIGVSNNKNIDTIDYVLGHFNNEEKDIISSNFYKFNSIIEDLSSNDVEFLMNKYN